MEDEMGFTVIGLVVGFLMGIMLFAVLMNSQERSFKEDAINNGCAEYVVDARGNTEFEWLDHNCKEKD